ncbi:Cyclin-dependent kinases regulatory subunit [Vanrija pseudolonga]|uniref:Cyclin-dependent kinases regulatory subunit n=1 Tax=Vanrija pseudolonga TaxID=143232 RepID=A0AAF1BTJ1_9TREE|nr:Cyclin-dependent kinases regulatory subunit [Vanrija pseudolonga]
MSKPAKSYNPDEKRRAIEQYHEKINYSNRYSDDEWEYRHTPRTPTCLMADTSRQLPKPLAKFVPPGILAEEVWRGLGIRQSPGWEMYMRHEPHVLLFRRPRNYDQLHPPLGGSAAAARLVNGGAK